MGPCPKVHDDRLKAAYEKAKTEQPEREFEWEASFERYLERLVAEYDSEITRAEQRLQSTQDDTPNAEARSFLFFFAFIFGCSVCVLSYRF